MVKVYAVVLVVGFLGLVIWIMGRALSENISRPGFDPEVRWGVNGRRAVAAAVGFGMAGMSAEFSPRDISWQIALVLALAGAVAAAWYAGWIDRDSPETAESETP